MLSFYAVGGPEAHRQARAALVQDLFPHMTRSVPKACGADTPWGIPSHVHKVVSSAYKRLPAARPKMSDDDVVVVIGHMPADELATMMRGKTPRYMAVQGPGFNCDATTLGAMTCGHRVSCGQDTCPALTGAQWDDIFSLYPAPLRTLQHYLLGGFFTSRKMAHTHDKRAGVPYVTSAFYNQMGLNALVDPTRNPHDAPSTRLLAFERQVVAAMAAHVPPLPMTKARGDVNHATAMLARMSPRRPVQETCQAIYDLYDQMGPWDDEALAAWTTVLLQVLRTHAGAGAKEYDGWTVHCLLRRMAGQPPPTREEHVTFIKACVQFNTLRRDYPHLDMTWPAAETLKRAILARHPRCRHIHVFHDLGLDPQCDDFLGLSMLVAMFA